MEQRRGAPAPDDPPTNVVSHGVHLASMFAFCCPELQDGRTEDDGGRTSTIYERIIEEDAKASAIAVAWAVYHLAMRGRLLPRFTRGHAPTPGAPRDESVEDGRRRGG